VPVSISFRQLEVFRAVAESRSFTRASHVLFLSQSTVSQHVRELEIQLQVKLLQRNRRTVALTPAGERLLGHSRTIANMLEEAEAHTKASSDPYSGKLAFGCASTTLLYQLPPILAEYSRRYPKVELRITGGTIGEVADQIWSNTLDLALVVLPIASAGLEKAPLFDETFVVAVPARHRLAARQRFNVRDLGSERLILPRPEQNTRKLIDRFLFRHEVTPKVAVELAETEAIKAMVVRGLGISILPASAFQYQRHPGIRTFPLPAREIQRSLALVYPKSRKPRPPALALMELLRERFRPLPR